MQRQLSIRAAKQAGFTLIELIIVIVIIGILAAVAIPKLTDVSDEATKAKNTAILGALKSAWSSAFAVAKVNPTATQIAAQMTDPTCTAAASVITCTGADTTFTLGAGGLPSDLTCTTASKCN